MSKLVVIPDFERPQACGDVLTKLSWFFSSAAEAVTSITLFAPFERVPTAVSGDLDPAILRSEGSKTLLNKIALHPSPNDEAELKTAVLEADYVLVWRKAGTAPLLASLAAADRSSKVIMIDEVEGGQAASRLAALAKSLDPKRDTSIERSREAFRLFKKSLDKKIGYVVGNGPSLQECHRLAMDDGHVIVSNELILNKTLVETLKPVAVAITESSHYAVPTRTAGNFRTILKDLMESQGLRLVVSMKDYPLYLSALPSSLHDQVIGLPVHNSERLSLNLNVDFAVAGFHNVMMRLMLPLAGSLFKTIRVCGLDGKPAALSAEQEDPSQSEPARLMERIARELERSGKTVEGHTSSYMPALRRRGAAEPVRRTDSPPEDEIATVLSITPDLRDRVGHYWNYEQRLGPKLEAGGLRYEIAASVEWAEAEGDPSEVEAFKVDCSLYTYSYALANKPLESDDYRERIGDSVKEEFTAAIDRALERCKGQLHVYMYCGSLEHAAILYEIALERPRVSIQVNLFWFRSADAWMPWFLDRWLWLLKAADTDPRLTLTCMTAHQRRQINGRSGITIPIATHPSPLLDDEQAWSLLSAPLPNREKKRIFFPSTNRPEKGTGLLYEAAQLLVDEIGDQDLELIFRTSPVDRRAKLERDPIYPFVTLLDGHIEESEFIEILRSCHAVVLPYMPPDFADRTSGLVIDALYAGTPAVVVRGTFLAEITQRYGSGVVVDRGTAADIAEAVLEILDRQQEAPWDFRESGKLYYRSNSWQRLAAKVQKTAQLAASSAVPRASVESDEIAVSLLGPVPREQEGSIAPLKALRRCLGEPSPLPASANILELRHDILLQMIGSDGKGLTLTVNKRAEDLAVDRLRNHHPELASRMHVEAVAANLDGQALQDQVKAYCDMAKVKTASVLISSRSSLANAAADICCARKPHAALISFDDALGSDHAEAAKLLFEAGYLVCIAEEHPLCDKEAKPCFRRMATYPFVSDLPWARGTLLALPKSTSLTAVKAAVLESGQNLDFRLDLDPRDLGAEILERAAQPPKGTLLASAALPNAEWQLAGLEFAGMSEDGFARLIETEALRVHRSALRGKAEAGKALTFSVEVVKQGRRFVSLWLSDSKNTIHVETVFDIDAGVLVSMTSLFDQAQVFAAAVPIAKREDGSTAYRLWVSLTDFPEGQLVQAQLSIREKASGPRQLVGHAQKGVLARNFMLEANATPSLFPKAVKAGRSKAQQAPAALKVATG